MEYILVLLLRARNSGNYYFDIVGREKEGEIMERSKEVVIPQIKQRILKGITFLCTICRFHFNKRLSNILVTKSYRTKYYIFCTDETLSKKLSFLELK